MSRQSLTALAKSLGIMETDDPFADVAEEELIVDKTPPSTPLSDTALQLDDWTKRRGLELTETNEFMQSKEIDELEAADLYGAAFLPEPKLAEHCKDPQRHEFLKAMMETPDYQNLHQTTSANVEAAELAACSFAEHWSDHRAACAEAKKKAASAPPGSSGCKPKMPSPMGAASRALSSAASAVSSMMDTCGAFGLGGNGANPGGSLDKGRIGRLMKKVAKSQNLKKIIELAGRFRRVAQSQQRQKAKHGLDEVVGIVQNNDIPRLLPQELAQFADPDLELDFLRRLQERQTLCFDFKGIESVAKGPIIVVVDESGSMGGNKIETAKALALAMAWIARKQKRWCCFMAFSGGSEHRTIVLEPGKPKEEELVEWLEGFIGGGTTLDVPLVELPAYFDKNLQHLKGKTDVLCITDAIVSCPPEMAEHFLAWKKRSQCKMITFVIEGEPGDLAPLSDQLFQMDAIEADSEAVHTAVSI